MQELVSREWLTVQFQTLLEDVCPIIVEHWFYKGSRAPHRFVCDDLSVLLEYFDKHAGVGDAFHFWRFDLCCSDAAVLCHGSVPNANGELPPPGAY